MELSKGLVETKMIKFRPSNQTVIKSTDGNKDVSCWEKYQSREHVGTKERLHLTAQTVETLSEKSYHFNLF